MPTDEHVQTVLKIVFPYFAQISLLFKKSVKFQLYAAVYVCLHAYKIYSYSLIFACAYTYICICIIHCCMYIVCFHLFKFFTFNFYFDSFDINQKKNTYTVRLIYEVRHFEIFWTIRNTKLNYQSRRVFNNNSKFVFKIRKINNFVFVS